MAEAPCAEVMYDLAAAVQDYPNLARTRMTVCGDHGLPVGVATLRALSSAAALCADKPASSANTERSDSARSAAAVLLAAD
jgi:hypothetical protein